MKTINYLLPFLLAGLFFVSFSACEDEYTEVKIGKGITISIPVTAETDALKEDTQDKFYTFSGVSQPISMDDDIFNSLKDYPISDIQLLVKGVTVKVTKKQGQGGTSVKDFSSATTQGSTTIANYSMTGTINLGEEFSEEKLTAYVQSVFEAIQNRKTVKIEVSGETDIIPVSSGVEIAVITIVPDLYLKYKLK